jgi:poly-gamma-glutamate capsule biosynthesis protein CapA/YwtB (metallophosphatase superfamily)/outer membrane protein assembly factor BamB
MSLDWRFDANSHLTGAQTIQRDGQPLLLLASLGRTVYALTSNGQIAWRLRTDGPVYALATLEGDRLAAGDDAGAVIVADAAGRRLWRQDLDSRVTALRGGSQGGVLVGGWDERLSFLDDDGTLHWQATLDGPLSGIATLPGLALAATLDGQVRAFDPTGREVWRFDAGVAVTGLESAGTGSDATVLLSLQDGRLLALDSEGALRWQQTVGTGGPVWHIANLIDGADLEIIAGTGGLEPVLTLLSSTGELLWHQAVPSPVGAITALDVDGDSKAEILVGLADGQVRAYDSSGRLRGSVHAGLSVWKLQPAQDGSALILADVGAWKLAGGAGQSGGPWLSLPSMAHSPPDPLPAEVEPASDEAILVFLGDVAPGRSMEAQLARYGPAYPWTGLGRLLHSADLAVANLECVLATQGNPLNKSYLIRAHPRWGQTLVEADFDLVTLANNHALDFGPAGLDGTLATLQALGITTVGAGASAEAAHRPATFTLNGVRVAVLGYAASRWNGSVDVPATDRVAWAEPATVQADVRAVREQADLVVVLLHAGTEYATTPSPDQEAVARAAVDAGADLVVGHHPHVTQTIERYRQGLIVYSLGDALFDIPRRAAMEGHLLRVHATQEGLSRAELWPFWIQDAIRPQLLDDAEGNPRFTIIYP